MRLQFLSSFIITSLLLLFALAIISPPLFNSFLDIFREGYQLLMVLLVIAIMVLLLRRVREI